ncbi:MAG: hypothetical protein L3J30_04070 [Marinosulfonomonas sp.]|nr:hypothetical protein [Marinosulfonomonas sp.]
MNLHSLLQSRAASGKPVRVGLIGAGKFGSMFLAQIPAARRACKTVGWGDARVDATCNVTKLRREMEAAFKP